jgi:monofunctional biosynthetic peptidoglycan transglycosylase
LRAVAFGLVLLVIATAIPIAVLRAVPPPTTSFMLWSLWSDPATGLPCRDVDYEWVPWHEISPWVPRAVLVAEDQRFLQHGGFDTKAIRDALTEYAQGGRARGASTVTQQVAKNLFLWPGRSVTRKGLEAWLTLWIEALWPKRRILEVHLNIAQFGPCVFGVEAASRRYFGSAAAELSAEQAARLAAVLPSPGRMRVDEPGPFTKRRVREVLAELESTAPPSYLPDP